MFHIEFVGAPGAGKSSVKKGMIRRLRQNGQVCLTAEDALLSSLKTSRDDTVTRYLLRVLPSSVGRRLLDSLFVRSKYGFIAQNHFLSDASGSLEAVFASALFQEMSPRGRELALSRFLRTAATYQAIREQIKKAIPVAFDEGFFQRGTSLFLSPSPARSAIVEGSVFPYFDALPSPDLLVVVEADLGRCFQRLESRGLPGRLKDAKGSSIAQFLKDCLEYVGHILKWAEKRKGHVLRIDNNGFLPVAVKELSNRVLDEVKRR